MFELIDGGHIMQQQVLNNLKIQSESRKQNRDIAKRIRYLQRELVRASFMGEEKSGLCRNLLNSIQQEREKIRSRGQ